jgi:hypothetical protein
MEGGLMTPPRRTRRLLRLIGRHPHAPPPHHCVCPSYTRVQRCHAHRQPKARGRQPRVLNVNPREGDCSPEAAEHWRRHTRSDEAQARVDGPPPGCRPEEISAYGDTNKVFDGINVWEELYPAKADYHTWAHQHDRYGLKGYGQRIDHFVVSKSLLSNKVGLRVREMRTHMGPGTSDHWPISLWFEPATGAKEAERAHTIRLLNKKEESVRSVSVSTKTRPRTKSTE